MKKLLIALVAVMALLVTALPGLAGSRAEEYDFEVIDYPGAVWTDLVAINNRGEILGVYGTGTETGSFVYYQGTFTPVDVPGAFSTGVWGNNDRGDIAGAFFPEENVPQLGFLLEKHGTLTFLDVPGSVWTSAHDVSNAGTVVGFYEDQSGQVHGYTFRDGIYTYPIDVAPPDPALSPGQTRLNGINNQGQIAGIVTNGFSYAFAFIMEPDGTVTWPTPLIQGQAAAITGFWGLNDHGQAVGTASRGVYIGWLHDRGEDVIFDNIPSALFSWISGVNNRGDMVGYFVDRDFREHGVIIRK